MKIQSPIASSSHLRTLAVAAGATLFLLLSPPARAAVTQILHDTVPAAVAVLQSEMALPGTNHLDLAIGLPLRNQGELDSLLQQIYDPASPNYHHYLTPAQFAERFGPTDQDYQALIAFAQANGLTVTRTHPNRVVLDVSGSVAAIQKALHVNLHVYQHPMEARKFYAPDAEPSLDLSVPVLHINGLDDFSLPRPLFQATPISDLSGQTLPGGSNATNTAPASGSGPAGLYMGYDFRAAYIPDVSLTGSGQSVALFELDGYFANDISTYESLAGLPSIPLRNVLVDGFSGSPGGNNLEVALDIEMVAAMSPGVSQIIVYEGLNNGNQAIITDMLNQIANDDLCKQISSSWLLSDNPIWDVIYRQYASQGQSFLQASGDNDAFVWSVPFQQRTDNTNITLVGGTTLSTSGPGGAWASEKVWNWGGGEGSGGGISPNYAIPAWQQGIDMSVNKGSTTFRNIPDVALTADNIFVVADNGGQYYVGGTSAAAPLWAGLIALVNQQALINGTPPAGFINPRLYQLGKGSTYAADFHDIKTGNNTWSGSPSSFSAVAGYDLCTGWGTPAGQSLVFDLAGLPPRQGFLQISVNPPSGSALLSSSSQSIFVTVNDVYGVTNATVTASIPGVTNLTFLNNGVSPDAAAHDSIYSVSFQVPASTSPLTMTVTATAPSEIGVTNVISYSIVTRPPNDNFTNATKVPVGGASYLANNRQATLEPGEPQHDGDAQAGASLWWLWTPSSNTNVFINTIGSTIDNVLAVYTGSSLVGLTSVVATNSNLATNRPAYVKFNAVANTTYHIAVASQKSNTVGSVSLQLVPGGQPDTNAPLVTVTSPSSGLTVSNNVILFTGTASDPPLNASGISQVLVSALGVVNTATGTTNWTANVALRPGVNTIQVTSVDWAGNSSAPVTLQVIYFIQNPVNDFFAAALPLNASLPALAGLSGVDSVSSTNATKEIGEPDHAGNYGGKSVWWWFQPSSDGVLSLNTQGSTFDTLLGLYTGSTVSALTTIANNDDAYPGAPGGYSRIDQAVRSNVVYRIAVDGYDGVSGNVVLTYSFVPATLYHLTVSQGAGGTVQVTATNGSGGVLVVPALSGDFAAQSTVGLTASPNPGYQFDIWNGSWLSLNNPLSVVMNSDMNITGSFRLLGYTDGFETGNFQQLPWTTAGNAPWIVQTNVVSAGHYAAKSGAITNSQTSSLILTANFKAGYGAFDYFVSSELNFDVLNFYLDGGLVQQWSGAQGWATFQFPLTAGAHTLQWTYLKDPDISVGLDAGFIDNVNLPIIVATNSSSAAYLQLQRQTDGAYFINLSGQANQQYVVQSSTNLITWRNLSTNVLVGGFLRIPEPAGPTNQNQFYRAVVAP